MIALLLMQKIFAMFLMMLVGFVLVRLKTFRPEESLVLSRIVVLLCCAAPTASVITQMAQVYGGDSTYANLLNVATTILCIVTIPLSVALYLAL